MWNEFLKKNKQTKKSVDERIGSPIFLITAGVFGVAAVGGGAM